MSVKVGTAVRRWVVDGRVSKDVVGSYQCGIVSECFGEDVCMTGTVYRGEYGVKERLQLEGIIFWCRRHTK